MKESQLENWSDERKGKFKENKNDRVKKEVRKERK